MFSTALRKNAAPALHAAKANSKLLAFAKMSSASNYETLSVTVPKPFVYHVELNRPKKMNAISTTMWYEIGKCFEQLGQAPDCRAIVLSGAGKIFTAGIDLHSVMKLGEDTAGLDDLARKANALLPTIRKYQECITALDVCPKPVLAAVHSACIGAGVDLITAADMRYCTADAYFQVKETDIGMAADVGTLQRLPKVIGSDSLVRELCYTARKMLAAEALSSGLVSKTYDSRESLIAGTIEIAQQIAEKSPVAVQTTKRSLTYSRDHTVQEGLDHIASLNQFLLQSEDFVNATMAQATKRTGVTFEKL